MTGMAAAVARVQAAIANREPILIYGDYDVDGTVAVVLLKTAIERDPSLRPYFERTLSAVSRKLGLAG